ncbi:poly-beta-1,6-N-acetyl-D-glucosamine N-deacetylase PgaB [Deferribacter abyssi]|uniref:poly-beta-1,6-N-acetyl-D-glucosamine N-deacetylase PgaB n=1 Tax=Deferribacter abyssi TaxID=213806 RepID=UPI003C155D90
MKKTILFFLFILFNTIILNAKIVLVNNEKPQKIVGVQIFNMQKSYKNNLDYYFSLLKKAGVNTVFIRVFQNDGDRYHYGIKTSCKHGLYFKSDKACTVYDILPEFIRYGKKYGIKIYAWIGTRKLSFLVEKYGKNKTFYLSNNRKREGYGVDLFSSVIFKELISIFRELARYNIDGILLQDDYILRIDESASFDALTKYLIDHDKNLSPNYTFDSLPIDFFTWKKDYLADLLNRIKWEVKKINPKIKFAVNIYYETLLDKNKGIKWYGQCIDTYNKLGFKYFASMLYSEQIKKEMKFDNNNYLIMLDNILSVWSNKIYPSYRLIAKLQIRDFKKKVKIDKTFYEKTCRLINKYNVSYILVPFEDLADLDYICK